MFNSVLVFSAHMDDETAGLGGFISENANRVHVHSFCKGIYGKEESRIAAFEEAMNILGCTYSYSHYYDLALDEIKLSSLADHVSNLLEMFQPEYVFCPSENDLHQDHKLLAQAVKIACRQDRTRIKMLAQYNIPMTEDPSTSENWDLSLGFTSFTKKANAIQAYINDKQKLNIDYLLLSNEQHGIKSNFMYAEKCKIIFHKWSASL